jgi:hypothetical protein
MRANRIDPHRTNLIVRCTKCKNFCAVDHANVSVYWSMRRRAGWPPPNQAPRP